MELDKLIEWVQKIYDDCRCVDTDISLECLLETLKGIKKLKGKIE